MDMSRTSDRSEALTAALMWAWAVRNQADRLAAHELRIIEATKVSVVAGTDRRYKEEFFHPLNVDRHFLFIAARQLIRALEVLRFADLLDSAHAQLAKVLRDCLEHWDERASASSESSKGNAGRAFRTLSELQPSTRPASHRFGAGGTVIGGLALDEFRAQVDDAYEILLQVEASHWVWRGGPLELPLDPRRSE